jgi:hypothetical protein
VDAAKEAEEAGKEKLANSSWTGNLLWLRLYCCRVHDQARRAILAKDNCLVRDELDARNLDMCPETFEAVVARLYNDPDIEFSTETMPELHAAFAMPINLDFFLMPGGKITAEDVKEKYGDARAKLIQVRRTSMITLVGRTLER